jgi:hypothetical protein
MAKEKSGSFLEILLDMQEYALYHRMEEWPNACWDYISKCEHLNANLSAFQKG